jgi:hypothetical protein
LTKSVLCQKFALLYTVVLDVFDAGGDGQPVKCKCGLPSDLELRAASLENAKPDRFPRMARMHSVAVTGPSHGLYQPPERLVLLPSLVEGHSYRKRGRPSDPAVQLQKLCESDNRRYARSLAAPHDARASVPSERAELVRLVDQFNETKMNQPPAAERHFIVGHRK